MKIMWIGATCAMLIALCGCAIGAPRGYVPAIGLRAANYTEDYIHEYHLETVNGTDLRIGGAQVKQFSKGGASVGDCCAALPGVGQSLRVVWQTGGYNDPESTWTAHTVIAHIKGTTSDDPNSNTFLILRFFPNNQIEAEYVAQSLKSDSPLDPRVDLLSTGQRVMRQMGK